MRVRIDILTIKLELVSPKLLCSRDVAIMEDLTN